jgi:protein-tyrosine phosphatase
LVLQCDLPYSARTAGGQPRRTHVQERLRVKTPDPDTRRFLRLQGVRNARDLGGYLARDGRSVRWGRVYRSGALGEATGGDIGELQARGLRVVCDLRSGPERLAAPDHWLESAGIASWGQPATALVGDSHSLLEECLVSAARTRGVLTDAYRQMPYVQTEALGAVFHRLARGESPLLFHCSAGKDRSGGAAALLLLALGVPDETVIEDYLLSGLEFDALCRDFLLNPRHAAAHQDPGRAWLPLIESDPAYIEALLEAVLARHGSIEDYLALELGIAAGELEALRAHLLE